MFFWKKKKEENVYKEFDYNNFVSWLDEILNNTFFISFLAVQCAVRLTCVLNRKNGFADGKIGAKVAVP